MTLAPIDRPHRPHRPPVAVGHEPVELAAPPAEQGPTGGAVAWQAVLPALGSFGALAFAAANPSPITLIAAGLFALAGVGGAVAMVVGGHRARWRQRDRQRLVYLDYLDDVAAACADTARRQRAAAMDRHPDPEGLTPAVAATTGVWERRAGEADLLPVRIGIGTVPLATSIVRWSDPGPLTVLDPVCVRAADDVARRAAIVPASVVTVDLAAEPLLVLSGDLVGARDLARAIVCSAAANHSPAALGIDVVADDAGAWGWTRWLAHAGDGPDPVHVVRIVDAETSPVHARADGVTELRITSTPPADGTHVLVSADGWGDVMAAGVPNRVRVDALTIVGADAVARGLAPLRFARGSVDSRTGTGAPATSTVADLFGIADPASFEPLERWRDAGPAVLRVPFAVDDDGRPVALDLREAALGGAGPHGLMVGATGSGKSEALRTIVLGLAVANPPELVSVVLVDFKGGAAFAGLDELPHVAGSITNLVDDRELVDRMHDALFGELRRRQELLRAAGNLASIWQYRERRAREPQLAALPHLVVVIDEFSELLVAKPELVDLFNAIGRLGRSLGIHLLFASQRLDESRLRGLDSHLSYRIALRTFNAADSRAVIGTDAASSLPSTPGVGLLATPDGVVRCRAALASAPYVPPPTTPVTDVGWPDPRRLDEPEDDCRGRPAQPPPAVPVGTTTVLDALVDRLVSGGAEPTRAVWVPPLPTALTLDAVLGPCRRDRRRGLVAADPPPGAVVAPFGLADRPDEQRQHVAVHEFTGAGSNLLVVGAPQSGKSTLLRAIVAGLALAHTPSEVQVYGVDLGGGGLDALRALPHVGAIATRADPERVGRIIRHATSVVAAREHLFSRLGIDGIAAYRARRAAGELPAECGGDVFVVIDNWAAFRTDFEELEPVVTELAGRAAGYGVHLVVSAHRAMDLRLSLKDLFGGRIELRLADPGDSDIDRRAAARLPGRPGRALVAGGTQVLVALARIDGQPDPTTAAHGARHLAARSAAAWAGPAAPAIAMLPSTVALDDLPELPELPESPEPRTADRRATGATIGITETDLQPLGIDLFGGDPHLLVFGETGSGKTELLRTLATSIVRQRAPDQVRFLVADPRRQLLDAIPAPFVAAYCPTAPAIAQAATRLVATLAEREPPVDVSMDQLRERSWWAGPDLIVLIDDYELLTARANPLAELAGWLPNAVDLGLHVVLARRSGGAARAAYDPIIQQLREQGEQGVVLSGDPHDGPLLGNVRPTPQPPGRGVVVRRRHEPVTVQVARAVRPSDDRALRTAPTRPT